MAGPGYRPPRLIKWPVVAGLLVLVAYVVLMAVVASSGGTGGPYGYSSPSPQQAWVIAHQAQLAAITSDQSRLRADSPSSGGDPSIWLGDWVRFHNDVLAASALPDPGGPASPYWHQMLGYYLRGSLELVGALRTGDTAVQAQAVQDLIAGDRAAQLFNRAMGLTNPSS